MITEHQQEQAALYALGMLADDEQQQFLTQLRADAELQALLRSLQHTSDQIALAVPKKTLPANLKGRVLARLRVGTAAAAPKRQAPVPAGLRFLEDAAPSASHPPADSDSAGNPLNRNSNVCEIPVPKFRSRGIGRRDGYWVRR